MLQLRSVVCELDGQRLLDIAELHIKSGQLLAVAGANGAGKSTLLKVIGGDLPSRGDIIFHGRRLAQWQALERARHLAVLPQASQLSFSFNAEEVVALGLIPLTISHRDGQRQVRNYMQQTDCSQLTGRCYLSLSGGERQRVQLARILLQLSQADELPLLLLDEPTSAQDLGQQHNVLQLTQQLCHEQNYGAMVILHDLNQLLRYGDSCCLLQEGQISHLGKPDTLLSNEVINSHWQYSPERLTLADGRLVII